MIIVSTHVVRPSVRPHFSKSSKTSKFQVKTIITTGETVGLAEWIIDVTCLIAVKLAKFLKGYLMPFLHAFDSLFFAPLFIEIIYPAEIGIALFCFVSVNHIKAGT